MAHNPGANVADSVKILPPRAPHSLALKVEPGEVAVIVILVSIRKWRDLWEGVELRHRRHPLNHTQGISKRRFISGVVILKLDISFIARRGPTFRGDVPGRS